LGGRLADDRNRAIDHRGGPSGGHRSELGGRLASLRKAMTNFDPGTIEVDPVIPFGADKHSYSYIIREGWLSRLALLPDFAGSVKKFGRNRMKGPIQSDQYPYLAVYFCEENMTPDGDSNAGAPKFIHLLKLGFQLLVKCNDEHVAEDNLNQGHWSIMNMLHSQDWFRFKCQPYTNENGVVKNLVDIEGVERIWHKNNYGNATLTNETPYAELQMEMILKYRSFFSPFVTNLFQTLHVEVAPKWPYDPGAYVPPFITQYTLEEN
jgi:hypothetical protein